MNERFLMKKKQSEESQLQLSHRRERGDYDVRWLKRTETRLRGERTSRIDAVSKIKGYRFASTTCGREAVVVVLRFDSQWGVFI
jgi:hypothetical protein